jgi:uncharacterized membrane protein YqjE
MAEERSHLLSDLQGEAARLWSDVRGLFQDRWELVHLEVAASLRSIRRLLFVLIPAVVVLLLCLPVLIVALATAADGWQGVAAWGWMLIFAGVLMAAAILAGGLAYRRFRRDFRGLEESLEELHEDLVWLREWTEGTTDADRDMGD